MTKEDFENEIKNAESVRTDVCVQCGVRPVGRGKKKYCSKECSDLAILERTEKHNESMRRKK